MPRLPALKDAVSAASSSDPKEWLFSRVLVAKQNSGEGGARTPVEAPEGTAARKVPLAVVKSTSTVGFPRLQRETCSVRNITVTPDTEQAGARERVGTGVQGWGHRVVSAPVIDLPGLDGQNWVRSDVLRGKCAR